MEKGQSKKEAQAQGSKVQLTLERIANEAMDCMLN